MIRLLLIRHATAAPGEPDEARALSPQGREEAARMGRWVASQGLVPGEVLCSGARRTRETLDLMLPAWSPAPRVSHLDELYAAGPEAVLERLRGAEGATVAVVGHNPAMGVLAEHLARAPREGDFRPCSVAGLAFEAEGWDGIAEGKGELVAFGTPGDAPA